jgi:hypothetical protein
MLFYSMLVITKLFTLNGLLYILAISLSIHYITSFIRSKLLVWLLVIAYMTFSYKVIIYQIRRDDFFSLLYFLGLRLISFCSDKIDFYQNDDSNNKKEDKKINEKLWSLPNPSLLNCMSYLFYPSFLFLCSFVPFRNFIYCVSLFAQKEINIKFWFATKILTVILS